MPTHFGSGISGGLTGLDGSALTTGGGAVGAGAGLLGQHQIASIVNPRNGQRPIDANQVRANDIAIATSLNNHDTNSTIHVQHSTTLARPAAGVAGRKWWTHDDTLVLGWYDSGTQWLPVTVAWENLLNRPSSFLPAAHTHPTADVVGLDAALVNRPTTGSAASFASVATSAGAVIGTILELTTRQLRAGSRTYVWPAADGTSGQVLTTDSAGNLSWVTPSGGGGGGSVDWTAITGRPSAFPPSAHTHAPADITAGTFSAGVLLPATQVTTGALPGGVTLPYGQLTGVPATFTPAAHTQAWSTITATPATFPSDWNTTVNRPATFAPSAHRHGWAELDNIPATFAPSAHTHPWGEVTGKPITFPPSAHTHPQSDITGLPATLSGKAQLGTSVDFLTITQNGVPVATLIVSESAPSGSALNGTFWVQV